MASDHCAPKFYDQKSADFVLVYRVPLHRRDPELDRGKLSSTTSSGDVRIDMEVCIFTRTGSPLGMGGGALIPD